MDMTNRQKKLIKLLIKNKYPMNSKQLCKLLEISPRTLRYDIVSINSGETAIIKSSKNGYELINLPLQKAEFYEYVPNKSLENEIDMELLMHMIAHSHYDLYDLSHELFMSEVTIINNIKKIKSFIVDFHLNIERKRDIITLNGLESDIRRLISYIIHTDLQKSSFEFHQIQKYFKHASIKEMQFIINDSLNEDNLSQDDFYLKNLLINLAISVERIFENKLLDHFYVDKTLQNINLSEKVLAKLESSFSITIRDFDRLYIQNQLSTLSFNHDTTLSLSNSSSDGDDFVSNILLLTTQLFGLTALNHNNLNSSITQIQKMIANHHSFFFHNEFIATVKQSHPTIYAAATYIASCIEEKYSLTLTEDEIGIIAIHLGIAYKEPDLADERIYGVVVCPKYDILRSNLANQLEKYFSKNLIITKIVNSLHDIDNENLYYDLIINTTSLSSGISKLISISPLLTEIDLKKIDHKIFNLKKRNTQNNLKTLLLDILEEKLFFKTNHLVTQEQTLTYLAHTAKDATSLYTNSEKIISVSFFNRLTFLLTPDYSMPETKISILINENSIQWDKNTRTNIVIFAFVNEIDRPLFYSYLKEFLDLFYDDNTYSNLMTISTYQDLLNIIKDI